MSRIELVVYDLDRTLWTISGDIHASCCTRPFRNLSQDVLSDAKGNVITLMDSVREVFSEWEKRGALLSTISANDYDIGEEILKKLHLFSELIFPQIAWEDRGLGTCDKKKLMQELVRLINEKRQEPLTYDRILFIDDRAENIRGVSELNVHCVRFGFDIRMHREIFDKEW
jgi:magnesium-dependent phosphatase-1